MRLAAILGDTKLSTVFRTTPGAYFPWFGLSFRCNEETGGYPNPLLAHAPAAQQALRLSKDLGIGTYLIFSNGCQAATTSNRARPDMFCEQGMIVAAD